MASHPTPADLSAAFRAGPAGAALAARWLDAVVAGIPSSTDDVPVFRRTPKNTGGRPVARAPARRVPLTAPERYGWRWWALRSDGVLVSPIRGAEVARRGSTFDADCACGKPASPDCSCGIHYVLTWRSMHRNASQIGRGNIRPFSDSAVRGCPCCPFGVAIGAVEVDKTRHADMPARRAQRWHMLALMSGRLSLERRAQLGHRYGCEVIPETSVKACQAVSDRLGSSLSPDEIAELASRAAAALI